MNKDSALEILESFLDSEMEDLAYFSGYEIEFNSKYDDEFYFDATLNKGHEHEKKEVFMRFKVCEEEKLYINWWEDEYREIEYFSWTVKYFWIQLLLEN